MAGTMARQWRRSLACHLHTVSQPWPHRDLQRVTSQLLVQCANEWGLSLPPVPDATPAPPTQVCCALLHHTVVHLHVSPITLAYHYCVH